MASVGTSTRRLKLAHRDGRAQEAALGLGQPVAIRPVSMTRIVFTPEEPGRMLSEVHLPLIADIEPIEGPKRPFVRLRQAGAAW